MSNRTLQVEFEGGIFGQPIAALKADAPGKFQAIFYTHVAPLIPVRVHFHDSDYGYRDSRPMNEERQVLALGERFGVSFEVTVNVPAAEKTAGAGVGGNSFCPALVRSAKAKRAKSRK